MGAALGGGNPEASVVINFSTPPSWLFVQSPPGSRVPYPDDPLGETWDYEQGTVLVDTTGTAFGDYYGRLVAHYV